MRINIIIVVFGLVLLAMLFSIPAQNAPVTLGADGMVLKLSIDDKIKAAELIMIGEVKTTLPSRWMGGFGNDPKNASPEEVVRARGLFTDSLISINQVLKGDTRIPVARVRAFTGQTRKVRWTNDAEPSYVVGKTYLLFLKKDYGPTAKIDPGDYIAVGAFQGVYEIVDGKAISKDDEWVLEELIAYIEDTVSQTPTP